MKNNFKTIVAILLTTITLFAAEFSSDYYNGLNYMYGHNAFDTNKDKTIDYQKSKKYFESSIEKYPETDIRSYFYLGLHYASGYGIEKDEAKALELYKIGAKYKDAGAMFSLAHSYQYGEGVAKKDVEMATIWYEKVITQGETAGSMGAMINLGLIYERGEGNVSMNKAKAFKYWSQCAKSDGNGFAKDIEMCQMFLSVMCRENPWACQ